MTDDERERLSMVERAVAELRERAVRSELMLQANTDATRRVERNTEQLVELLKGATALGRIARWVAAIAGAYVAGKGLKWW